MKMEKRLLRPLLRAAWRLKGRLVQEGNMYHREFSEIHDPERRNMPETCFDSITWHRLIVPLDLRETAAAEQAKR